MRERIETFRGSAWLEPRSEGGLSVFGSETADEALGVIVEEQGESGSSWRARCDDEPLAASASTMPTAVALVIAGARKRDDAT